MIIPNERLLTQEDIKKEYLKLRDLYHGMVGNLYTHIAYAELIRLRSLYANFVGFVDLPSVNPPNTFGYVH